MANLALNEMVQSKSAHSRSNQRNYVLSSLFVSSFFRHKYPEERVPTLEEALVECIKLGLKVFIDVKGYPDQVNDTDHFCKGLKHRTVSYRMI